MLNCHGVSAFHEPRRRPARVLIARGFFCIQSSMARNTSERVEAFGNIQLLDVLFAKRTSKVSAPQMADEQVDALPISRAVAVAVLNGELTSDCCL
jgi:hypothetical protein